MTDRYLVRKWSLIVYCFVQEDDEGAMARMAFADAMREGRPVHRALSQQAKDGTVRLKPIRPRVCHVDLKIGVVQILKILKICAGEIGVRLGDPAA